MINLAQIMGRVGKISTTPMQSGGSVTNISMVTTKKYVKNGEKVEKVTWHNVTCFNKLSEIAEKYVAIGDLLYIQGEMDSSKYTGNDGIEKTKNFIIAHELKLIPKGKSQGPEPKSQRDNGNNVPFDDSEIPF